MAYKIVGIDENSDFPNRVENRLKEKFSARVEIYGAKGDGVTDDFNSINTAINSHIGELIFDENKTYKISSPINITDKSIYLNGNGATLYIDHNEPIFIVNGKYSDPINVTSYVATTSNDAVSGIEHNNYVFNLQSQPHNDWRIGDIIKVASDDQVAGDVWENSNSARAGSFLTLVSKSANQAICSGIMTDKMTSNVRIAKLYHNIECSIENFKIELSDSTLNAGNTVIQLNKLVNPKIKNITMPRVGGTAVSVRECVNWLADQLYIGYGVNNLPIGAYGYGVSISCSSHGTISNSRFTMMRHAVTDGAPRKVAGLSDIDGFGRCYNNRIINCVADSCTESGFDTHTQSLGQQFINCLAINCSVGFSVRGEGHKLINISADGCTTGFRAIGQSPNGESWGHYINGLFTNGCNTGIRIQVNDFSDGPHYLEKDVRPITINNVHMRNHITRMGFNYNGLIVGNNWTVEFSKDGNADSGLIMYNGTAIINNLTVMIPEGGGIKSNLITFSQGGNYANKISHAELNHVRVYGGNANDNLNYIVNGANNTQMLRLNDIYVDIAPVSGLKQLTYTTPGVSIA